MLDRKDILHTLFWNGFRKIIKMFYDNNVMECRKISFVDVHNIW